MALSGRSTPYHERMNIDTDPTNKELNPELSYKAEQEKAIWVSMAANQQETTRPSSVHNEAPPIRAQHKEEVFNIQLSYDPHAPAEPELWSGSFHPISLHGSIEHFALDSKNIKVSLDFLAKYIRNKQVMMARLTISGILMAWVMPYGTLYLPSMRLNGTLCTLIKNQTLLEQKYHQNLP